MSKRILMVGLHSGYADMFRNDDELDLFVLEEADLYRKNAGGAYTTVEPGKVLLAGYQQSEAYLGAATRWHQRIGFDAVVPAFEYGVEAAWTLADQFGLRSPGPRAVAACTDKLTLRSLLTDTPVRQPRWAKVEHADDVAAFVGDRPVVLKPSNRHASVGVVRIDDSTSIGAAWETCVGAAESRTVADRVREGRVIVEEFVPGYQVSVETLVRDRRPIFDNVTLMVTAGGPYFPILAITVPAPIPPAEYASAVEASHRLVAALEVVDGLIHSEWKIHNGEPYLIESAARVPGALTPECADRAYGGFSMYGAQVRNLAGLDPQLPAAPRSIAGAHWFHPPAGRLIAIHGAGRLDAEPAVFQHRIKVAPGDTIPPCTDGWRRVGYFAAHTSTAKEFAAVVSSVLSSVVFEVAK